MYSRTILNSASAIALTTCALSPGMVLAQEVEPSAADDTIGIHDIVVTAEKRVGTVQTTPIAISAISGDTLEQNGVDSLTDISSIAPNVSFGQQVDQTIIVIRGVSSRDTTSIGDPAVSVSIDGVQLQRSSGLNASMFDLERVEVLRGPQGTLAGRNSTGGAINIITAKPTDEFSGSISAEVGSYKTFNTSGHVNVPINDWLKARVAFQTRNHDGYRNNAPGVDGDDDNTEAMRLTLALDPTDRLSGILTAEYIRSSNHGPAYYSQAVERYTAENVPPGLLVGDVILRQPDIDESRFPIPRGQQWDSEIKSVRGSLAYDFDVATLTYVGGWRAMDVDRHTWHGGAFGTNRQNFTYVHQDRLDSWTHELRLSGDANKPFFWQLGGYYFKENNPTPVSDLADYPLSEGLFGEQVLVFGFGRDRIVAKSKAAFGQVSYEVLPGLKVEAGARYTEDSKISQGADTSISDFGGYLASPCGIRGTPACTYTVTPVDLSGKWSKTTYHVALNWQSSPNNLHYVKFDTGYKAGGFGGTGLDGQQILLRPETIRAVEIGSKNRFLDGRLQVNLAAFYYDYSDQHINQFITTPTGAPASIRVNAGKSEYKGVEMDLKFQPTPEDTLDLFVGYTDAVFKEFLVGVGGQHRRQAAAEGNLDALGNWDLSGRSPPQSPKWQIIAGYGRDWSLFGGTLNTRVQMHYESKSYLNFENYDSDKRPAYTKTDLLVTYTSPDETWELQGYVRNIENSLIITNSQDATSGAFNSYRYQFAPPRTYGARLTVNF
ncbi:TonB-dependent receptor [Novosphingobium endophyticum]|uniref:TonB-dependent receptor n=1 Tax=Novosphingobium endophyticum TaxID=1955250 RepID=A0A916TWW1_9SPHN|nr:TonB-dependent receptor [Novosphingobium endophyticum]GGC14694.1 TonB-dependent receptor [Novosphingobium endophyticum]